MKRKIIIGLAAYSLVLLLGGVYVVRVIDDATTRLDKLIMLHQVEILREHFLVQVSRVQTDLALSGTPHAGDFDELVAHVQRMDGVINACFSCHHEGPVADRIRGLKMHTQSYKNALSQAATLRANDARRTQAESLALHVGEELITDVSEMVATTAARLEANTQKSLKEIDNTKYVLYVLVGITPLLSAVLGFIFISGLTSPVSKLVESTRKLKGGNLDHRVSALNNEFGELADAFNDMAASLKEQMLKTRRAEQLAAIGELAAGLAHEIKNPLAGIKVAMDVLATEVELCDEDRAVVRKVSHEITRLEALMKSFLDFTRPHKPQPTDVNVNALLNTTLAFYGETNVRTGNGSGAIEIEKNLGDVPATMADPMQLQQVFVNLLINARDAMPDGGVLGVHTSFDKQAGEISISISDTGTGIDGGHVDQIFQPFFTTKHGGTGLGLPVSRQLIELHGGSIGASVNNGGGTVFTVRLPLRPIERSAA